MREHNLPPSTFDLPPARTLFLLLLLLVSWRPSAASSAAVDTPPAGAQGPTASELNNQGVAAAQEGRFEVGVDDLRQSLRANPQDPLVRKNLSGILTDWAIHLEQAGLMDQAEPRLQEAIRHDPDNGRAYVLLGDLAYFQRSNFAQAIEFWKRANGKLPDAKWHVVADRISQARRDQAIERGFLSTQTAHFDIRVQQQGRVALEPLGRTLEEAYARLEQRLGVGPPKVTVIIYTDADMRRAYNQRDWAVGFYDGRLRLRWDEVATEWASSLIAHELAHAFLYFIYRGRVPIWVHEGFAQLEELPRERSDEEQRLEQGMISGASWIPLKWLDERFSHPTSRDDVGRAYVEARLVVAELVARHGIDQFKAFLAALSRGTAVADAYDAAFTPSRWSRTDQTILK